MENKAGTFYTLEVHLQKYGGETTWVGFDSYKINRFISTSTTEGRRFASIEEVENEIDSLRNYKPAIGFHVHKIKIELITSQIKNYPSGKENE